MYEFAVIIGTLLFAAILLGFCITSDKETYKLEKEIREELEQNEKKYSKWNERVVW